MTADKKFYTDILYPLQDDVLKIVRNVDTGFYLTGGTAASRGYLGHRFSDDLDLFVNDDDRFQLWASRLIDSLGRRHGYRLDVLQSEERFVRLNLLRGGVQLKIEMINDVPARVGRIQEHEILGRLDSPENILANKITALMSREEPKDLADVWGFCFRLGLPIADAILGAQGKAAGIFPLDLSRVLISATLDDWELVRWDDGPTIDEYLRDLVSLGESLILPT